MITKLNPLFFIIIIAAFLRLWQLSNVPPSPSLDEVSIGYNAYSILKTGKDEYGESFPILLRAYDDWRPALYAYLTIPFVSLFGLSALAVRLPSVILSVLTVFATYFLVKELFNTARFSKQYAITAAFLLAISPWHMYISRLGHEANAGLAFLIFAMLFFLKQRYYVTSLFFVLSFISYQSEKIVIPIIVVGLVLLFRQKLVAHKEQVILALLIGLIILIPFIKVTLSPNALIRFEATNIFTSQKERFDSQAIRLAKSVEEKDIFGQILYNRRVLAGQIFLEGYISHFHPLWLFANQASDRHKVPNLGLLYLWEAPLILLGIITFMRGTFDRRVKIFLLLWFFAAPLPAALTTDAPHAMRSYTMLPTWQIFSALGVSFLLRFIRSSRQRMIIFFAGAIIVIASLVYLYYQYFLVFRKTQSASFQYALSYAIPYVLAYENMYDKIIFSNADNLYQSYMFFLFYSGYDPVLYQKQGGSISGGFAETHIFGKYAFKQIRWDEEEKGNAILYVVNPSERAEDAPVLFEGYNLDGEIGTVVVENRK